MILLDMFCGLKSLFSVCKGMGIDYFGIDIDSKFNPDLCIDVMNLTPEMIPFHPDIIWASPPCEHFSVASIGKHWNIDNTPKTKAAEDSMLLVLQTIRLIYEIKPKFFFIENPRGKLRKMLFMEELPIRHTVTYCQYGDFRMKPTNIWTNNQNWVSRPICHYGDSCHISAPRGSTTGTQGKMSYENKSKVPEQLLFEILTSCM